MYDISVSIHYSSIYQSAYIYQSQYISQHTYILQRSLQQAVATHARLISQYVGSSTGSVSYIQNAPCSISGSRQQHVYTGNMNKTFPDSTQASPRIYLSRLHLHVLRTGNALWMIAQTLNARTDGKKTRHVMTLQIVQKFGSYHIKYCYCSIHSTTCKTTSILIQYHPQADALFQKHFSIIPMFSSGA